MRFRAPDSAQKPPRGWSSVIRIPIVFTIRQPPERVPTAIAACAARMIHHGMYFASASGKTQAGAEASCARESLASPTIPTSTG